MGHRWTMGFKQTEWLRYRDKWQQKQSGPGMGGNLQLVKGTKTHILMTSITKKKHIFLLFSYLSHILLPCSSTHFHIICTEYGFEINSCLLTLSLNAAISWSVACLAQCFIPPLHISLLPLGTSYIVSYILNTKKDLSSNCKTSLRHFLSVFYQNFSQSPVLPLYKMSGRMEEGMRILHQPRK